MAAPAIVPMTVPFHPISFLRRLSPQRSHPVRGRPQQLDHRPKALKTASRRQARPIPPRSNRRRTWLFQPARRTAARCVRSSRWRKGVGRSGCNEGTTPITASPRQSRCPMASASRWSARRAKQIVEPCRRRLEPLLARQAFRHSAHHEHHSQSDDERHDAQRRDQDTVDQCRMPHLRPPRRSRQ